MTPDPEPGRTLAVDHGSKRIGLAIGDPSGKWAGPLATVDGTRPRAVVFAEIAAVCREYDVRRIVVGLPLNMDGTEGPQAKAAREFGAALGVAAGLPVEWADERLTSYAAESALRPAELTRGKRRGRVDQVAAQILLQAWLDARREGEQSEGSDGSSADDDEPGA